MNISCTLSEAFSPPEGYIGQSGILCALSATEPFIDRVLEHFTGRSKRARESEPGPYLFLLLDRASAKPSSNNVPGVTCLDYNDREPLWQKIDVMHAKVALLCFGRARTGPVECVRLIVSTGNWTEESSRNQIELVWACDLDLSNITDIQARQAMLDLSAAAEFFKSLCLLYHLKPWQEKIENIFNSVPSRPSNGRLQSSRFVSTLDITSQASTRESTGEPLLNQVCSGINKTARNFIVCGSGFFEQSKGNNSSPELLELLLKRLRADGNLTSSLCHENQILIINPTHCGQVADWLKGSAGKPSDWTVLQARDTAENNRGLHAKFLFLASRRRDSLSNGFCYIGSGNLSLKGFNSAPSINRSGNVEAGVCLEVGEIISMDTVKECMPWGVEIAPDAIPAQEPLSEEDPAIEFAPSCPVSCFRCNRGETFIIEWIIERACILMNGQELINLTPDQTDIKLPAPLALSPYATVCEGKWKWVVPILDAAGNLPRRAISFQNWDDLLGYLDNFSSNQAGDDLFEDSDNENDRDPLLIMTSNNTIADIDGVWREYPAHRAMQLIEKISERNQQISQYRLPDWADTLRRIFNEAIPPDQKTAWQELQVNFLSVLKRKHFAPHDEAYVYFDRSRWNELVDDLAHLLGIYEFPAIDMGVKNDS